MTRSHLLGLAAAIAAAGTLAACATTPPNMPGPAVDAAYGLVPNPVPDELMRPDGLMINGLLPPNVNEGS